MTAVMTTALEAARALLDQTEAEWQSARTLARDTATRTIQAYELARALRRRMETATDLEAIRQLQQEISEAERAAEALDTLNRKATPAEREAGERVRAARVRFLEIETEAGELRQRIANQEQTIQHHENALGAARQDLAQAERRLIQAQHEGEALAARLAALVGDGDAARGTSPAQEAGEVAEEA